MSLICTVGSRGGKGRMGEGYSRMWDQVMRRYRGGEYNPYLN